MVTWLIFFIALLASASAQAAPSVQRSDCVMDVMMVVDRSGSIGLDNWQVMVRYLRDRVNRTDFNNTRMGIVAYASTSSTMCGLQETVAEVSDCIDSMTWTGGWTNTAAGIAMAGEVLAESSGADRRQLIEGLHT